MGKTANIMNDYYYDVKPESIKDIINSFTDEHRNELRNIAEDSVFAFANRLMQDAELLWSMSDSVEDFNARVCFLLDCMEYKRPQLFRQYLGTTMAAVVDEVVPQSQRK